MAAYQPPKSILVHGAGSFESYLKKRSFFFFNDPAPTEIYTLSLHDALPTSPKTGSIDPRMATASATLWPGRMWPARSEEHTSELQSHVKLVCRLRLEKKKPGYGTTAFGSAGVVHTSGFGGYEPLVREIVTFFQTGWPPVGAQEPIVFFNFTATTEIYTLSLHDALPI